MRLKKSQANMFASSESESKKGSFVKEELFAPRKTKISREQTSNEKHQRLRTKTVYFFAFYARFLFADAQFNTNNFLGRRR